MKRLIGILLCCFLLLPLAGVSAAAEETGAKRVPAPIYYQTFENCAVEDFMGEDVLIKNNTPKNLSTKISEKDGNHSFFFSTRNKNNESQTMFRLYELPENVTDYSVIMRVSFDSSRTNWSGSGTSRVGLAYAIRDGANYSYADLRYKGGTKSANLRRQLNETGTASSPADEGTTANKYSLTVALDTVYEMAIAVKDGKISYFINGKLIRTDDGGTASSIDYIADGRGVGIYGAYTSVNVDEFRVYGSAYLPDGYDTTGGAPFAGDAGTEPLPVLSVYTAPRFAATQEMAPDANQRQSIRFIGVLDSLDYQAVGYEMTVTYTADGKRVTKSLRYTMKTVYTELLAGTEGGIVSVKAEAMGGRYLLALSVKNVPTDAGETVFTVTPFAVAMDGTVALGATGSVTYLGGICQGGTN